MKKVIAWMGLFLGVLLSLGCTAHQVNIGTLDGSVLNRPLPDHVLSRTFLPSKDTSLYMYNVPQLVGTIMTCDKASSKCDILVRVTKKQKEPTNQFLQDKSNRLYRSVIDNKFSGGATVLPVTVTFADNRKVEVIIEDSMCVTYNDDDIPRQDLIKAYKRLKKNIPNTNVYWIRGAILMTITRNYYDEISDNATITAPVFSVNGKVFMSKDEFVKDQRIVLSTLDLEKLASMEDGLLAVSKSPDSIIIPKDYFKFSGTITQVSVSGDADKFPALLGIGQAPSLVATVPPDAKVPQVPLF